MSEVTAALAKSKVAWLLLPPDVTVPCWYAASEETAYLVGGDGEQTLPPLPAELRIILRDKETRRAIGPVPARATRVHPDSEDWNAATTALLAARQSNPPDGLREHWADQCAVWSLDLNPATPPPPQPDPAQVPRPEAQQAPTDSHADPAPPGPTTPD